MHVAQSQTQKASGTQQKISNYVNMIVLIVVILSVASLVLAVSQYNPNNPLPAAILAAIGLIALTMSMFLLYQSRRQSVDMKIEIPKVMTTIECANKGCASKTQREFQRGDYIYKEIDTPCGKCGGKQMVTAIYKEVKEKEKTYNV